MFQRQLTLYLPKHSLYTLRQTSNCPEVLYSPKREEMCANRRCFSTFPKAHLSMTVRHSEIPDRAQTESTNCFFFFVFFPPPHMTRLQRRPPTNREALSPIRNDVSAFARMRSFISSRAPHGSHRRWRQASTCWWRIL